MADSVAVPALALFDPSVGSLGVRLKLFVGQPAIKRVLPWFLGLAAIGGAGLTWSIFAPSPQRVLYNQLDDSQRASIVAALDKGGIGYHIDNETGVLTVDANQLYKARMLVAENGALSLPDTETDNVDKLPLGASRAVEDAKLQADREHELESSIKEIDGVQSVRVHLAEGQASVFVRDTLAPSASVMLRLAEGRQLSSSQTSAVVNLVAASVPGLLPDAVRVIDQHGDLLTRASNPDSTQIDLQNQIETKLENQVSQLLTPMLGDGNFSTTAQVALDMNQVTSARESYDKQGALRSETQEQSSEAGGGSAVGIPGVLSNTPPPQTQAVAGAPQPSPAKTPANSPVAGSAASATPSESSASRTYELGREVAVSNQSPGTIKRLSVAVALSASVMAKAKPGDIDQIKNLIAAAVGDDPTRGDVVTVMVRSFNTPPPAPAHFYEASWFATLVHNGVALLAVLLVLMFGVRPLVKALRRPESSMDDDENDVDHDGHHAQAHPRALSDQRDNADADHDKLGQQVALAQRLVAEKPADALIALRQMLQTTEGAA